MPVTSSFAPARPFSFTGARRSTPTTSTVSASTIATALGTPTPRWTVAIYEPGLEHVRHASDETSEFRTQRTRDSVDELVEASLALAEDVAEAQRHASSSAAADTLELLAHRLRRGEILLLPGASTQNEAAVLSSVLAALLGGRR